MKILGPEGHISDEGLAAYVEHRLKHREVKVVEAHICECPRCEAIVLTVGEELGGEVTAPRVLIRWRLVIPAGVAAAALILIAIYLVLSAFSPAAHKVEEPIPQRPIARKGTQEQDWGKLAQLHMQQIHAIKLQLKRHRNKRSMGWGARRALQRLRGKPKVKEKLDPGTKAKLEEIQKRLGCPLPRFPVKYVIKGIKMQGDIVVVTYINMRYYRRKRRLKAFTLFLKPDGKVGEIEVSKILVGGSEVCLVSVPTGRALYTFASTTLGKDRLILLAKLLKT
jgi:hypothetical protein